MRYRLIGPIVRQTFGSCVRLNNGPTLKLIISPVRRYPANIDRLVKTYLKMYGIPPCMTQINFERVQVWVQACYVRVRCTLVDATSCSPCCHACARRTCDACKSGIRGRRCISPLNKSCKPATALAATRTTEIDPLIAARVPGDRFKFDSSALSPVLGAFDLHRRGLLLVILNAVRSRQRKRCLCWSDSETA